MNRLIDKIICLFTGHDWAGRIRGDTMTRHCLRCGKFEMKDYRRRK